MRVEWSRTGIRKLTCEAVAAGRDEHSGEDDCGRHLFEASDLDEARTFWIRPPDGRGHGLDAGPEVIRRVHDCGVCEE